MTNVIKLFLHIGRQQYRLNLLQTGCNPPNSKLDTATWGTLPKSSDGKSLCDWTLCHYLLYVTSLPCSLQNLNP